MLDLTRMLKKLARKLIFRRETSRNWQNIQVVRLGSEYGGWLIPKTSGLNHNSICYLVGAGEDVSFDLALAKQFQSKIRIVDPTPKASSHVQGLLRALKNYAPYPINNSKTDFYDMEGVDVSKIIFNNVGLAGQHRIARFYVPRSAEHASYSMLNIQDTDQYIEFECFTLKELMAANGDERVDLLKMDIEGAEYEVLADVIQSGILPKILLVEFDELHSPLDVGAGERVNNVVAELSQRGMDLAAVEGCNYTFLRKS